MTGAIAPTEGAALARLAARVVGARLVGRGLEIDPPVHERLRQRGASFVTLERRGALRGCVGSVEPVRALYRDVARNAARAMTDPRMPAVTVDDWAELDVKVSVLSAPEPVATTSLPELVRMLRPGVDGLLIGDGERRATFLPAVWHKLPEPDRFVAALLAKGGWSIEVWPAGLSVSRYTSVEFCDPAPRAAPAPDG